jgi:FMN phosphatase YigB (HAD superfamily)
MRTVDVGDSGYPFGDPLSMPSSKPAISLVVTDLDNTLYDWVTYFVTAFYEMVSVATALLEVPEDELLDQLQAVHRYYHDAEYPFALLETNVVRAKFGTLSRRQQKERLDPAFDAFNEARDRTLRLYPGVAEALREITAAGAKVVGHTEASAPNALFRLRKLGCLPYIERIYAIEHTGEDHPIPEKGLRFAPERDRVHFLRHDQRKPNPDVLLTICREYHVAPSRVLYVGDSISRDIGMAREAGARSAFARYGTQSFDKTAWAKLVRITHWSDEDVERAQSAQRRYGEITPDVVLSGTFAEILDQFTFGPVRT